jgi:hypothetical protein
MASIQLKKEYEGKSDGEVFEAAKKAIVKQGLRLEVRDLARPVLGTGTYEAKKYA